MDEPAVPADGRGAGGGEPLHAIGEAARLTGVSAGILRLWERERLIAPARTAGGHRLYSARDLDRLRLIDHLRRVERLNAAAIRRELGAVAAPTASRPPDADGRLGARLRTLRAAREWSLAEVAARSGLSISFLSAVERGQSNPSVGNLFKLADAYGTTVPGLAAERHAEGRSLLRPTERPRYVAGGGLVLIEDLIVRPGALEAQRIEIAPGGGSEEPYAHPGEEFVYVLAGELVFWIDEVERHRLGAGDALAFRSTRPHRWWNEGGEPAVVLWINVPVIELPPAGKDGRGAARARPEEGAASGPRTMVGSDGG